MKKKPSEDFYLKVTIWSLFCLLSGLIAGELRETIINAEMSEKQSSAAQIIQSIRICQASFSSKNEGKFATFAELVRSGCLDDNKISGEQPVISCYIFTLTVEESSATKPAFFSLNADPQIDAAGARHFYYDSTLGTVKITDENRPANAADPSF